MGLHVPSKYRDGRQVWNFEACRGANLGCFSAPELANSFLAVSTLSAIRQL